MVYIFVDHFESIRFRNSFWVKKAFSLLHSEEWARLQTDIVWWFLGLTHHANKPVIVHYKRDFTPTS